MALSRSSLFALLCVCMGLFLLVGVTTAAAAAENQQPQEQTADNAVASTQQYYLRGTTVGAVTEGKPMTADSTQENFDSFSTAFLNDYGGTPAGPNCRPKPCKP